MIETIETGIQFRPGLLDMLDLERPTDTILY